MTGDPFTDVFVLRPGSDPAARTALLHYASIIQRYNPSLALYLRSWVSQINDQPRLPEMPVLRQNIPTPEEHDLPGWLMEQQRSSEVKIVYQVAKPTCGNCGAELTGRQKAFCSDACRQKNYRDT